MIASTELENKSKTFSKIIGCKRQFVFLNAVLNLEMILVSGDTKHKKRYSELCY